VISELAKDMIRMVEEEVVEGAPVEEFLKNSPS
jgi:hypothetical protein